MARLLSYGVCSESRCIRLLCWVLLATSVTNVQAAVSTGRPGSATTSAMGDVENQTFTIPPAPVTTGSGDINVSTDIDCYTGTGTLYAGTVNSAVLGYECDTWSSKKSQAQLSSNATFLSGGESENNCRNPVMGTTPPRVRPWCVLKTGYLDWQYCNIPQCGQQVDDIAPIGTCQPISTASKLCTDIYGSTSQVFIPAGGQQHGAYSGISQLYSLSKNAFYRSSCLRMVQTVLCSTFLPRCVQDTKGTAIPLTLCQEDCHAAHAVCGPEYAFSIYSIDRLSLGVILPSCATLPSSTKQSQYRKCHLEHLALNETDSCYRGTTGRDYNGRVNVTTTGKTCLRWLDVPAFQTQPPTRLKYTFALADTSNQCRDLNDRVRPWCVTSVVNKTNYTWEYCNIPECTPSGSMFSPIPPPNTGSDSAISSAVLAIIITVIVIVTMAFLIFTVYVLWYCKAAKRVHPITRPSYEVDDGHDQLMAADWQTQSKWAPSTSRTRFLTSSSRNTLTEIGSSSPAPHQRRESARPSVGSFAALSTLQIGMLPGGLLSNQAQNLETERTEEEDQRRFSALYHQLERKRIESHSVRITQLLGQGEFSRVFAGETLKIGDEEKAATDPNEGDEVTKTKTEAVAVKCAKDAWKPRSVISLLEECVQMAKLDHPHVMWMVGVCIETDILKSQQRRGCDAATPVSTSPSLTDSSGDLVSSNILEDLQKSPLVILPMMEHGDLSSLLRSVRLTRTCWPAWLTNHRLVSMTMDIASGLEYLTSQKCVHRDLAARNCLVDGSYSIAISDFGLSRAMNDNSYYRQEQSGRLPVKWMAPECLNDRLFTRHSDVWAFGITLWEIFSLGQGPYPGISNFAVSGYISSGGRLEKPSLCPVDELFQLMRSCWEDHPRKRPSIADLRASLEELRDKTFPLDSALGGGLGPADSPGYDYVDMMPLTNGDE